MVIISNMLNEEEHFAAKKQNIHSMSVEEMRMLVR